MNLKLYFEVKKPSGTYAYFTNSYTGEVEKQYLYDNYYYSNDYPMWRVFEGNSKEAKYFYVIHCMNKDYKLDFECIFLGKESPEEAFSSLITHFTDARMIFCGLEIFNISLFEKICINAKNYKKAIISCEEDFKYLYDANIVDESYTNVAFKDFGFQYFTCKDNVMRPKYFVSGKFETFHNINLDFDNFEFNKSSSNQKAFVKSINDFFYTGLYSDSNNINDFDPARYSNIENLEQEYNLGKFGEISIVNRDDKKSLERKIGVDFENHFEKPYMIDLSFMNDKINFDIKRVAAFIVNNIDEKCSNRLDFIKRIIEYIHKHSSELYTNYGFSANNHNIKKIIKYITKNLRSKK